MTCIAGIRENDRVYIAGDRMGSNGFTYSKYKQNKVFINSDFLFGVCGDYRAMQLLQHKYTPPDRSTRQSDHAYLFKSFTDSVIELFRENNAVNIIDSRTTWGGSLLFAYNSRLYVMHNNFQILEPEKNYYAVGSGEFHAIASLYSTDTMRMRPETRLRKAIVCASEFVLSVDDNIDVLHQDKGADNAG